MVCNVLYRKYVSLSWHKFHNVRTFLYDVH